MMDDSKREEARALIAEAREETACNCDEDGPMIGCGTHGDNHSKVFAAIADLLEAALTPPADPTDDEREALAEIIAEDPPYHCVDCIGEYDVEVEAILKAGFRRPTPATREEIAEVIREHYRDVMENDPSQPPLADTLLSRFTVTKRDTPENRNVSRE